MDIVCSDILCVCGRQVIILHLISCAKRNQRCSARNQRATPLSRFCSRYARKSRSIWTEPVGKSATVHVFNVGRRESHTTFRNVKLYRKYAHSVSSVPAAATERCRIVLSTSKHTDSYLSCINRSVLLQPDSLGVSRVPHGFRRDLSNNVLTTLPAGIFESLSQLTDL